MNAQFDVPYNGDLKVLDLYKEHKDNILMVYGRADDIYPNGRNTKKRKPITLDEITKVSETLSSDGIKFNYILNGNFHGNQEYDRDYRKKFIEFISECSKT